MATATYFNCWTTLLRYAVNWKSSVELKSRQACFSIPLVQVVAWHPGKKWQRESSKRDENQPCCNSLPYCYMCKLCFRLFVYLCSAVYVCVCMCKQTVHESFSFTWPGVECTHGSLIARQLSQIFAANFAFFLFCIFSYTLT